MYALREVLARLLYGELVVASKCRHSTRRHGAIVVYGSTVHISLICNSKGVPHWCLACTQQGAVRCTSCSQPIVPGDPVCVRSEVPGMGHGALLVCQYCTRSGEECQGVWVRDELLRARMHVLAGHPSVASVDMAAAEKLARENAGW